MNNAGRREPIALSAPPDRKATIFNADKRIYDAGRDVRAERGIGLFSAVPLVKRGTAAMVYLQWALPGAQQNKMDFDSMGDGRL